MKRLITIAAIISVITLLLGCSKMEGIFDGSNKDALAPIVDDPSAAAIIKELQGLNFALYNSVVEEMGHSVKSEKGSDSQASFSFVLNDRTHLKDVILENGRVLHWPDIDFEKYSLVLGYYYAPYPWVVSKRQRILVKNNNIELYVERSRSASGSSYQFGSTREYACYLYPKLPNLPVEIIYWDRVI